MTNAEILCKNTDKLAETLSFSCTICPLNGDVKCSERIFSKFYGKCRGDVKQWLESEVKE